MLGIRQALGTHWNVAWEWKRPPEVTGQVAGVRVLALHAREATDGV